MDNVTVDSKTRVLVLGDSGVGKTSFVHRLCQGAPLANPSWTVGCHVDIKLHVASKTKREHLIELWEIGGSSKHEKCRTVFYGHAPEGIILVYDLTNRKSRKNLWRWLAELSQATKSGTAGTESVNDDVLSVVVDNDFDWKVPILIVGTKADLVKNELPSGVAIAKELHCSAIAVSSTAPHGLEDHPEIDAFFDAVVSKKDDRTHSRSFESNSGARLGSRTLPSLLSRDSTSYLPGGASGP